MVEYTKNYKYEKFGYLYSHYFIFRIIHEFIIIFIQDLK